MSSVRKQEGRLWIGYRVAVALVQTPSPAIASLAFPEPA